MPTYTAPVRDMEFIMYDVLKMDEYQDMEGYGDADRSTVAAILEEGAKISQEVIQPINLSGDEEGCHLNNGIVTTPKGFKEAYQAYAEGGWSALTGSVEFGGQGLPYVLGLAMNEMVCSANFSFSMYPGLTHGAIEAIEQYGSTEQKEMYLPKLISGEWTGTMNLTEAHAGTDLGLLRTKAVPQADGTYLVNGSKIFISAGDHDLTDNIIHLVLARLPDAPPGVKGISLFIVPKILVNADGSLGARNPVECSRLEEKLGIHGNSTCVLNFEDAVGYMVGEANKGLVAMFAMMNAARLGVGVQGLSIAQVAYENAAAYAKERLQMRALTGPKAPDKPADPIIVHPDIRRMLLTGRSFCEAARGIAYWAGLLVDMVHKHPDPKQRQKADDLLGLLTPVIKAYFTDMGTEVANLSLQCLGGHGYIKEWGLEQFVRDVRVAQIYEGANGIQALDLVGRKLPANKGRAVQVFFTEVGGFCEENADNEELAPFIAPVMSALEQLFEGGQWMADNGVKNPDHAGAGATNYLYVIALSIMGFMWVKIVKVAQEKLAAGAGNEQFYKDKLTLAKFFFERMMPDLQAHMAKLKSGADTLMAMDTDSF
ncbi:MAG: acyl-CoA dehydrogenase C-terminal domain-containing protein [Gammaproteobacteria bacterium]|nr:acyl-CoA dehydrogenase C-terminal domain-containing protein [Gammaproteobacteria bacterium]MCP5424008.1 acyl-CoA dehydrogenase C-terminal domain-containing protein [Gammaproteobacteria bacterium]